MELWADALAVIVLAILIDRFIGDVPNAIHPLRWMGNILDFIDKRIKNRTSAWTSVFGFLSYLLVFFIFGGIAILISAAVRHFVPVGKPAPPRPRRPEVSISVRISSGVMVRAFFRAS